MSFYSVVPGFSAIMAVLLLPWAGISRAEEGPVIQEALDKAKLIIKQGDSYEVIQFINSLDRPEDAAEVYSELVDYLYWEAKQIPEVVVFARAGIQFCLTKAEELRAAAPDRANELKRTARVISYNLASFTWVGWSEKDIVITYSDILAGLDAARLNIRLVQELNEGDQKLAISYWVYGAQLLAVQKYEEATAAFVKSKEYARQSADRLNELLADGYIGVSMIISAKDSQKGRDILNKAIKDLNESGLEDSQFVIDQFNTALNVFIK
jgi:tetratricopeptide (TPR) repeat protein